MNTTSTSRMRRSAGLALLLAALAAMGAGCGRAIPSSHGSLSVKVGGASSNRFLTDGAGHTLYMFEKDEGEESYCSGACAAIWPPYELDGKPTAAAGLKPSLLGTIKRDDGDTQVTYNGHPLYYYAGDASKPGSTDGNDLTQFGAGWYLLSASGGQDENASESQKPVGNNGSKTGGGY